MAQPNFWDNQEKAQKMLVEMKRLRAACEPLAGLLKAIDDVKVLEEFEAEDPDTDYTADAQVIIENTVKLLDEVELQAMLGKPEDAFNAYLSVQAGEGGTDAADFADMLLRMYIRWAEMKGYSISLFERTDAEEAGIRHATILIKGENAYGWLKGESGNHRLVRMSPFNSSGKRQTSFAAVDVTPEIDDTVNIEIDWDGKDIVEDTMRAGGAGGQHINKTESAVRVTHVPTGIAVRCESERSQHQNRETARKMLIAKLYQLEMEKRENEISAKRGEKSKIGFGGITIRNYVLQPEQFVKDTRSELKTANPLTVLEGYVDPFMEAYLRWSIGQGTAGNSDDN